MVGDCMALYAYILAEIVCSKTHVQKGNFSDFQLAKGEKTEQSLKQRQRHAKEKFFHWKRQ